MNYPYIYRGKVLSNDDSKNLGRCKIVVPSIHGTTNITANLLPWARCISNLPVNSESGSYCIPAVDDIVWVFFEGGDLDSPVYLGGSYSVNDISISKDVMMIYQNEGDIIAYDKSSGTYQLHIGGSVLDVSGNSITVHSGTIEIKSGTMRIDSNVTLSGNLNINGNLNISGTCNKECNCSHG